MANELNWKVAGFAGEGIMTTGLLFSKTCARHGMSIFDYTEYPSLIRGGHNTYQVYANTSGAFAQRKMVDVLVALNRNSLSFHKDELSSDSLVIYDQDDDKVDINDYALPCQVFNLQMVKLAIDSGGQRLMANNVILGASVYFFGMSLDILLTVITAVFQDKGESVVKLKAGAALAGYEYAKAHAKPIMQIDKGPFEQYLTATGNEAISLGALAGGLQFYAAYPMTPSSSILHYLSATAKQTNIVVKHAEDEISAINMACGASFAGARAMVGTSGGGFCYMTEGLGLAGIAELPLVVFEGMRPGPALGMPTWTAQGDLGFILNASQDEFPRFVLTPGDAQEAFELTRIALELAEKYQTLVMLVSDKYLSESRLTFKLESTVFKNKRQAFNGNPQPDESGFFPRYLESENGVSPRTIPGTAGGTYIANSYEHDKYGLAAEEGSIRLEQMDKRFRKFDAMRSEVPRQYEEREAGAEVTLVSFGSTKGVIRAARTLLKKDGIPTNTLNLSWIWPFPKDQVKDIIGNGRPIVVEGNKQGQLARLIAQETGMMINDYIRRYDGRPFYAEDIASEVKKLV